MAYTYQPYPTVSVGSSLPLVETILKAEKSDKSFVKTSFVEELLTAQGGLEMEKVWFDLLTCDLNEPCDKVLKALSHPPFFMLSIKPYCTINDNGKWFLNETEWKEALKTCLSLVDTLHSAIYEQLKNIPLTPLFKAQHLYVYEALLEQWKQKRQVSLGIKDLYTFFLNTNKGQETKAILAYAENFMQEMACTVWTENKYLGAERGELLLTKTELEAYNNKSLMWNKDLTSNNIDLIKQAPRFSSVLSLGITLNPDAPNFFLQTSLATMCNRYNDVPVPNVIILTLPTTENDSALIKEHIEELSQHGFLLVAHEKAHLQNVANLPVFSTEESFVPSQVVTHRPKELECDVVRFQNNKEKWVAFVGLLDGYPYEIFTGLQDDEEGIVLPKTVLKGKIIKKTSPNATSRYDFQFENKRGYKTTVEGLSEKFNPEYWNYAKLISGVLRYRMPLIHVIRLVGSLQLKDASINTWTNGVERALKRYLTNGTFAPAQMCSNCGKEELYYIDGNLVCKSCGCSKPL